MKTFLCVVVVALVAAVTWFQLRYQVKPLPVYKEVPPFTLTERSGRQVSADSLKGKVWLAEFFYSTCPGPCPMISTNVAALQKEVLALSPDTLLVSFSLDPAKDTPEVLQKYADNYEASKDRWLFLTGDPAGVENLVSKGFLVSYSRSGDSGRPVIHGTQLALIDRKGRIRAFYDGEKLENTEQLLADVRRLLRE